MFDSSSLYKQLGTERSAINIDYISNYCLPIRILIASPINLIFIRKEGVLGTQTFPIQIKTFLKVTKAVPKTFFAKIFFFECLIIHPWQNNSVHKEVNTINIDYSSNYFLLIRIVTAISINRIFILNLFYIRFETFGLQFHFFRISITASYFRRSYEL